MKINQKINYEGYLIERGGLGFYVLDWDWETERDIAGPFKHIHQAQNWINKHNQGVWESTYSNPSWVDMPR